MHAVGDGYYDMAELLIDAGADINIKDNKGKTALDIAEDEDYQDIVELLENADNNQDE